MKLTTLTVVLLCTTVSLFAQPTKQVKYGNVQWLQYYNQTNISENWSLLVDGGYRWSEQFSASSQYVARAAAGYYLTDDIRIATGVAHLGFYSDGEVNRTEIRPYQELRIRQKLNRIGFNNRLRLEQRFFHIKATKEAKASDSFNYRFRYRFQFAIPLVKSFPNQPDQALSLQLGDEIFLNAGNEVVYNIFDQNRILLGTTYKVSPHLAFSFTYSNTFVAKNIAETYTHLDIFWVGIKHKIDLTEPVN
ncbi:DUF2490 domain-containing protein [Flammeovirgaceae bacterium SG7u.111]|nr:DUF2490 domain-containing protein [Flammeovirgaceae bacterium SG7u.132]WPO34941.1 DUF2490 domain-containing protein [Flammeovirgaceae bacterium SG7u.111]